MVHKNQIKIDGLEAAEMRLNDIPEVLNLVAKAQSRFKVFKTSSPSTIFKETSLVLQKNFRNSIVLRSGDDIVAALVLRAETSISAELVYVFSAQNAVLTEETAQKFKKILIKLGFFVLNAKIQTFRKDFEELLTFLKNVGFAEITSENDAFTSISVKIA